MTETAAEEPRPVRVVAAPLVEPSSTTGLLEVFRRRHLLRLLVRREVSARYQGSLLGMIWSYINPLTLFLMYYVVIGVILQLRDIPNFGVHMFCGLVVTGFFTETLGAGTRSIVRNKALVSKLAVPREMFPVASMLVSGYHLLPQLLILGAACVFLGWTPDPAGMLLLVFALLLMALLGTALALLFATANVYFRDVGNAIGVLSNFVRFSVPMIYPFVMVQERFGETVAHYFLWNPIAQAVVMVQRAFWIGTMDGDLDANAAEWLPGHLFTRGLIVLAVGVVLLVIAQWVFSRLEKKIPEHL